MPRRGRGSSHSRQEEAAQPSSFGPVPDLDSILRPDATDTPPPPRHWLPSEIPRAQYGVAHITNIDARPVEVTPEEVEIARRVGIVEPLIGIVQPDQRIRLVAGRRRLAAARAANLSSVPMAIYGHGTSTQLAASLALIENNHRRGVNAVTDLAAIQALVRHGATYRQIAEELQIPLETILRRVALASLRPELLSALEAGRLTEPLARHIASLPAQRQVELHEILSQRTLTAQDLGLTSEQMLLLARDLVDSGTRMPAEIRARAAVIESTEQNNNVTIRFQADGQIRQTVLQVGMASLQWHQPSGQLVRPPGSAGMERRIPMREAVQRLSREGAPTVVTPATLAGQLRLSTPTQIAVELLRRRDEAGMNLIGFVRDALGLPYPPPSGSEPPTVRPGNRPERQRPAPSDDRELTEAELTEVRQALTQVDTNPAEETWARVTRLLEIAERCLPATPEDGPEIVWASIQDALDGSRVLLEEESRPLGQGPPSRRGRRTRPASTRENTST